MSKKPVKMHREELAAMLRVMATIVEAGDSFEGSITYSVMDDIFGPNTAPVDPIEDLERDQFYVGGMYRAGNSQGQGSVNLIWELEEGPKLPPLEPISKVELSEGTPEGKKNSA